jgi:hypothetical protein
MLSTRSNFPSVRKANINQQSGTHWHCVIAWETPPLVRFHACAEKLGYQRLSFISRPGRQFQLTTCSV